MWQYGRHQREARRRKGRCAGGPGLCVPMDTSCWTQKRYGFMVCGVYLKININISLSLSLSSLRCPSPLVTFWLWESLWIVSLLMVLALPWLMLGTLWRMLTLSMKWRTLVSCDFMPRSSGSRYVSIMFALHGLLHLTISYRIFSQKVNWGWPTPFWPQFCFFVCLFVCCGFQNHRMLWSFNHHHPPPLRYELAKTLKHFLWPLEIWYTGCFPRCGCLPRSGGTTQ